MHALTSGSSTATEVAAVAAAATTTTGRATQQPSTRASSVRAHSLARTRTRVRAYNRPTSSLNANKDLFKPVPNCNIAWSREHSFLNTLQLNTPGAIFSLFLSLEL